MKRDYGLVFSLFLVILGSFIAGILFRPTLIDSYDSLVTRDKNISEISQCEGLELKEAVYCLRDHINSFYKYKLRDGTFVSIAELKREGGDCADWSLLYKALAESIGLKADIARIHPDEGQGHVFAVIWDKNLTGYCLTEIEETKTEVQCIDIG